MAQGLIQLAPKAEAAASASLPQAAGPHSLADNTPPLQDRPIQARALQVVKGKNSGRGELHCLMMVGEPTAEESLRAVQAGFRATTARRFFNALAFRRQVVSVARLSSSFQVTQMSEETPLLQHPVVGFHHAVFNEQLTKAFRKPEVLGSLSLTDILTDNEVLLVEWKIDWARLGLARTVLNVALALVGGLDGASVFQM